MTVKSVRVLKNKNIYNKKGSIIKFINNREKNFKRFGEIYFSEIKLKKIKGWNYHKKYTCIITVPYGLVEFYFFNKKKKLIKKKISKREIIIIPPRNWFAFKSIRKISIIANLINGKHNDKETRKSNLINNININ